VYCHFSEITVNRGDKVEKGDIVGKIGSTGRVTGPHLHWSVRIRGSRVDPNALLSLEFE
jgi:murein DD-endopeptidase MepM/ murein hydrolase activator NlpD